MMECKFELKGNVYESIKDIKKSIIKCNIDNSDEFFYHTIQNSIENNDKITKMIEDEIKFENKVYSIIDKIEKSKDIKAIKEIENDIKKLENISIHKKEDLVFAFYNYLFYFILFVVIYKINKSFANFVIIVLLIFFAFCN